MPSTQTFRALAIATATLMVGASAHAEFFGNSQGGTDFPQGVLHLLTSWLRTTP